MSHSLTPRGRWRTRMQQRQDKKGRKGRCREIIFELLRWLQTLRRSSKMVCWSAPSAYSCSLNHLAAADASASPGMPGRGVLGQSALAPS